jgi:hypothetical protein
MRAHICALTESLQYSESPGRAIRRRANSRWNMRMQVRGVGERARSLNTRGDEICERVLLAKLSFSHTWSNIGAVRGYSLDMECC